MKWRVVVVRMLLPDTWHYRNKHALSSSIRLGLIVALASILVDQASKWWILVEVMDPPKVIPVTSFFNFVLTWNRGVSFGLFNNEGNFGAWFFSILAIIIVGVLLIWLRKAETKVQSISLGFIIGGAIGNVIDRVNHLGVLDFIDFHLGSSHWPAFNAADSFITLGAAVLIVDSLFSVQKNDDNDNDNDNVRTR